MPHAPDGAPGGPPRRLLRRLFDQLRRRAEAALLRLRRMQAWLRARPAAAAPEQLAAGLTLAVADVSRLSEELEAARAELSAAQAGLEAELARRTTELVALNARLAASEDRLRLAQLHGRGGSWDWDVATGAMTWSEGFHALCGLDPARVEPSRDAWRDTILPEDREAAERDLRRGLEGDEDLHLEYRIAHPDRGVLSLATRGRVSFDAAGRPLRVLALVVDVTERRDAQAKLAATNEALQREVAARVESEGRLRVLVAELQHRTRNLLAVVRGIAHQTIDEAASLAEFRALLDDRMRPLSEVQSLLSRSDAEPITLEALLRLELTAVGAKEERVTLAGPAVTLHNAAVQTLALALHELATNARKHGALAGPAGRLAIRWSVLAGAGPGWLRLDWTETGVAAADRSGTRMGYGRELIERALPYSLGARTGFSLEAEGLRCFIEIPLE